MSDFEQMISRMEEKVREWDWAEFREDWFVYQHDFAAAATALKALSSDPANLVAINLALGLTESQQEPTK